MTRNYSIGLLNSAIVLAADPTQQLRFQYMPEDITDIKSVNWVDHPVVGRAEPIKAYAGSTARNISFTLFFAASDSEGDDGEPVDVRKRVDFCQSLVYPDRLGRSQMNTSPPLVYLIIGEMLNARCVCRDYRTRYTGPWHVQSDPSLAPSTVVPAGGDSLLFDPVLQGNPSLEVDAYATYPLVAQVSLSFDIVTGSPQLPTSSEWRNGAIEIEKQTTGLLFG